jgi:hypothetical protein
MLDWRGDDAKRLVKGNVAKAMGEFVLTAEGESKKELRRGHGVVWGTLRRSIHGALPGYDWGGDDVESSAGSQERGGSEIIPDVSSDLLTVELGSGLKYAMAVHQRKEPHGGFTGYHYITNGINKTKSKLDSILAKHKVQR